MGDIRTLRRVATIERARELRRNDTDEARLWNALRARRLGGWRWKRQAPWSSYFLDFLSVEARLVVEVDGGQHAERVEYDARRTRYIERSGLRVLRFWNHDVLTGRDGVCFAIREGCGGEREAPPLPRGAAPRGRG
jgi:very-short-patch-repair endonuclease